MLLPRFVQAENEPDTRVGTPAIQMFGLAEVGVATQQRRAKTTFETNTQSPIDFRRRAFVGRPIAGPIEQTENFTGVGQRHDERMVSPEAVVGDVHAELAFAGGPDEHAIHVPTCIRSSTSSMKCVNAF